MTARVPPCSTNRQAASTFGPIEPLAKWPSAASARIRRTSTRPSGSASGVPKRSTACGTSVAITSTSASTVRASSAAPRSLSMTASTPRSRRRASRTTGMPPPPLATTTKPASTRACTAAASMISRGSGDATTRRQPRSPRSCQVSPCSTSSAASSRRQVAPDRLAGGGEARVVGVDQGARHDRGAAAGRRPARAARRRARSSARSPASPGSARRTSPAAPGGRRTRRSRSSPAGCRPAGRCRG